MRRLIRWLAVAAFVFTGAGSASAASILYDNGAPNGVSGVSLSDFQEADDFVLGFTANVTDVHLWTLQLSAADYLGSLDWAIFSNAAGSPGVMLATGSAVPTRAATGNFVGPYAEFTNDFTIPAVLLTAGTYWLGIHDGPLSANSFADFYWETANANATNSSMAMDLVAPSGWLTNTYELAFNVTGEAAVPEPASLLLMATGFAVGASRRMRRSRT